VCGQSNNRGWLESSGQPHLGSIHFSSRCELNDTTETVERNVRVSMRPIRRWSPPGEGRQDAIASMQINFLEPDEAPTQRLNAVLWRNAKGNNAQIPRKVSGLFHSYTAILLKGNGKGSDGD
jgi:hypothetical protein